jgi:D-apiose dehydrogenase
MKPLRFAILGAGFWARYQLAAWRELPGAQCVALCDPIRAKAEALAHEAGGGMTVYADAEEMLARETPDFVDIIAGVEAHQPLTALAAQHRVPVICQKPLGRSLEEARAMVEVCRAAGVPLFVHENWRWQAPLRALKKVLESGQLGTLVRGRIDYANSFPVFVNQPFLKELDQFILMDIGTHILDVARFLWGEARELYCQTRRMHPEIQGEDVATVMLRMTSGLTVTANMSYASKWEFDRFPETFVAVEGTRGGVSLGLDHTLKIITDAGIREERVPLPCYSWADPAYALIHTSIVECHRNLLGALRAQNPAETTGEDNLKTLALVFASYQSARSGAAVQLSE